MHTRFKRSTTGMMGFGMFLVTMQATAAPIPLPGGVLLTPSLDSNISYDDNVANSRDNQVKSFLSTLSPTLLFEATNGVDLYSLSYTAESGRYHSSSRDDYVDHQLLASADVELSRGFAISLDGGWIAGHEERGTGFSRGDGNLLGAPDEFFDRQLSVGLDYAPRENPLIFGLSVHSVNRDYDEFLALPGRDRESNGVNGSGGFRFGSRTVLIAEIDYSEIDFDFSVGGTPQTSRGLDNRQTDYLAGIDWNTAKTSLSIRLGERHKVFRGDLRENFVGPRWILSMDWSPLSYSTISISSQRATDEPRGFGDFIDTKSHAISWRHGWTNQLSTNTSHASAHSDYYGISQQDDSDVSTISLDYQFRSWMSVQLGFNHSKQRSTQDRMNFDRNVAIFGATISM